MKGAPDVFLVRAHLMKSREIGCQKLRGKLRVSLIKMRGKWQELKVAEKRLKRIDSVHVMVIKGK